MFNEATTSNKLITNQVLISLLIFIVVVDLGYSFFQHKSIPMDGDLGALCAPDPYYARVLEDPLGLAVLLDGESYLATNRFFAHYSIYYYFKNGPKFWQLFFNPIEAIYWNAALFKLIVQALILVMLAKYLRILYAPFSAQKSFIWYLFLLTPLFQTKGFNHWMGIIDPSITYTFFYAWPMSLLLVFYYPFLKRYNQSSSWSWFTCLGLVLLGFCLPFASPILPPVIILITGCFFLHEMIKYFRKHSFQGSKVFNFLNDLDLFTLLTFCWITLWSFYSYYIGMFNLDNVSVVMSLSERYSKLLLGVTKMITDNLGLLVPTLLIIANAILLKTVVKDESKIKAQKILFWVSLFCIIYIVLLPLGGYRPYRPLIVRRDTAIPILISIFIMYGSSTFYLLTQSSKKIQNIYLGLILGIFIIHTVADEPNFDASKSEREGLEKMANAQQKVVPLAHDQLVFAWDNLTDTTQTRWNAQLIYQLGITDTIRLYYNLEQ